MGLNTRLRGYRLSVAERIGHAAGMFELVGAALAATRALALAPVRTVFLRQVHFTGLQALARAGLIGSLIGILVLTQVASLVGKNAALGGRILVWVVIRELGPLFTAILVISRSSSAIAAELASMRVNRELDVLRGLGIPPLDYLVMPRVLGVTAALVALTIWFEALTIAGGAFLSSLIVQLPLTVQLRSVAAALAAPDLALSLFKSAIFGLVISGAACFHGLEAGTSITEIPQVTTRAVMLGLSLVVVADALLTVVFSA